LADIEKSPEEQIVEFINRVYRRGLTTTSGGNLSMRGPDGDLWITPGSIDKGELRPSDVVHVARDGSVTGPHKPSLELPFHQAIYAARSDAHAVIHAHAPALVTFSIGRKVPDTRIIPNARGVCGSIGYAKYALPGSVELAGNIAETLTRGHNITVMENHSVVCLADSLREAYMRLETLDLCGRIILDASKLGEVHTLTDEQLALARRPEVEHYRDQPTARPKGEREARAEMVRFLRRGCRQGLFSSAGGTISRRLDDRSFLITPYGIDRALVDEEDLVLMRDGRAEAGKFPSRAVFLHERVYRSNSRLGSLILAQPPFMMAFAVSHSRLDTLLMPETYVFLREVDLVPYGPQYLDPDGLARRISPETPVLLIENECIVTAGATLLEAYDRLEVAEFSARSFIDVRLLGGVQRISQAEKQALEDAFIRKR
jgi:L-fuculose-phosphate aldolase